MYGRLGWDAAVLEGRSHLQGFGVDGRQAGEVGVDLQGFIPSLLGFPVNLVGLLLQGLCQLLRVIVPGKVKPGGKIPTSS